MCWVGRISRRPPGAAVTESSLSGAHPRRPDRLRWARLCRGRPLDLARAAAPGRPETVVAQRHRRRSNLPRPAGPRGRPGSRVRSRVMLER